MCGCAGAVVVGAICVCSGPESDPTCCAFVLCAGGVQVVVGEGTTTFSELGPPHCIEGSRGGSPWVCLARLQPCQMSGGTVMVTLMCGRCNEASSTRGFATLGRTALRSARLPWQRSGFVPKASSRKLRLQEPQVHGDMGRVQGRRGCNRRSNRRPYFPVPRANEVWWEQASK